MLSATADDVLNGANAALIGEEILQWQVAELLAANTYRLSKLLRGRRGTEWAVNSHAVNDRFVLLSGSTIQRIPDGIDLIWVQRYYKAVSAGRDISSAIAETFVNTASGLKPFSPAQLRASRNAAGDLSLSWLRRTRIGGGWRDNADVPLGEAVEAYEIDILNGSTVVRTIATTTAVATYTAAQQTADFGSVQASITMNLYQLSATVGRGQPLEITV